MQVKEPKSIQDAALHVQMYQRLPLTWSSHTSIPLNAISLSELKWVSAGEFLSHKSIKKRQIS